MVPPDVQELAIQVGELRGQIEGAISTLRAGMAVIGGLLALLIGSVVFSFMRLASVVETLRKRSHKLVNYYNLVAGKMGLPIYAGDGE